jgi:DNA replication and repair protein RecF
LIILDLAMISVYHSWHSEYPLFLMDDVDAELDRKRIDYLLGHLEGRTQTFVTTSKEGLVTQYASRANVFEVRDGMALERGVPAVDVLSTAATGTEGI